MFKIKNKLPGAKIQNVAEKEISKTQIDRLGNRLKKGDISDDDLRLLDIYRGSFSQAYGIVVERIRDELALEPTGRLVKSTKSLSDKLRRESIRLTQIQDIAGCRLIVPDIAAQDATIQSLQGLFENAEVVDRRIQPSRGYRAVHVIVNCLDKTVEVQIRTSLQHLWAELSEKFSDVFDPAIKYGGGGRQIQRLLMETSSMVANQEFLEVQFAGSTLPWLAIDDMTEDDIAEDRRTDLANFRKKLGIIRQEIFNGIRNAIEGVEKLKGESK